MELFLVKVGKNQFHFYQLLPTFTKRLQDSAASKKNRIGVLSFDGIIAAIIAAESGKDCNNNGFELCNTNKNEFNSFKLNLNQ